MRFDDEPKRVDCTRISKKPAFFLCFEPGSEPQHTVGLVTLLFALNYFRPIFQKQSVGATREGFSRISETFGLKIGVRK